MAQHTTIAKTFFYNKPNGKAIFYLNKGVSLTVFEIGYDDVNTSLQTSEWREARANVSYYLKANVKNYILQKNSKILDENKREIGRTLADINILEKIDTSKPIKDAFEIWLNGYTRLSSIHELSYKEILQKVKLHFASNDESSFVILNDNDKNGRPHYKRKEITYKVESSNSRDDESYMLLKTCKTTYDDIGYDDDIETKHKIEVTCFPNIYNRKDSIVFKREGINTVELMYNYNNYYFWQILTKGCCLSPTKIELADFKTGKTLITCLGTYYEIQFEESNDFIFLGYEHNLERGNKNGVIGFLNYNINGKKDGRVVFKSKQKNYADSCYGNGVSNKLIQIDSGDIISEWENYKIKIVYDYYNQYYDSSLGHNIKRPKFQSINDATGIGMEFIFIAEVNGKKIERKVKIIFNNGEVQDKEIVLDFD